MRPFITGLAATLAVLALAPAAVSQGKKAAEISEKARTQGMAEAPALAKAAGISCNVTDALFVGKTEDKKAKTKTSYYEIDCDQGVGFVLSAVEGGATTSFTCIEAGTPGPDGKPSNLACKLPGNADPKADLAGVLAAGKVQCTPEAARGIGQSATATYLEVACQGSAQGYVLKTSAPIDAAKPVEATDCMLYDGGQSNISCTLRTKEQRLAVIDTIAAQANNGCTVKDKRYMGMSQTGSSFFEAACADGKGYLYRVDAGKLTQTYDCAKAQGVMGGCTLTDTKEAVTEQNGLYTKLAKAAGFNCDVSKYAPFPSANNKDIVEMACSNRPDGGVGVFGGPNDKPIVYDCARAPIAGYRCSFTKLDANSYGSVTADLKKLGKPDCAVSNARVIGKTAKGTTYLEVACADGLKGYVMEYSADLTPLSTTGCAFTKDCKLPGNV
ncbi:hypothetical protein GGQ61_002053 [Phenylobacterium haematophilum]|uniref:Uncharacterized protein n=1 Tax=Phenylobacterium haematophilum TaxID=98513 RepID=A0A839ZY96_9CAUL|nr:hypothetical protein [Phenylobacterium haematophilum]MBB3891336.1 hypothetical protein [Phenylobacterium haematophilum]